MNLLRATKPACWAFVILAMVGTSASAKNPYADYMYYAVERTTGTTTLRAAAVAEAKLIHPTVPAAAAAATPAATRTVQVQHQRGCVAPNGSVQITFVIDARGPRHIADCFLVKLDAPSGPALPVTVRAEISGEDARGVATTTGGRHLSSTVKVLGTTL